MREPFDLRGDPFPSPGNAVNPAPTTATSPDAAAASVDIFSLVRRGLRHHWRLALATFAVLGLGTGAALFWFVRPVYTASALFYVDPILPSVAFTSDSWKYESMATFVEPYKTTILQTIAVPPVLKAAAEALDAEKVAWRDPGVTIPDAMRELKESFLAEAPRMTNLIVLSLKGERPERLAPIVNQVATKFLARLGDQERERISARLSTMVTERGPIEARLKEIRTELAAVVTTSGGTMLDERQNVLYDRMQALDKDLTQVALELIDAEGAFETAKKKAADLRAPVPASVLESAVSSDQGVASARGLVVRSRSDLESAYGDLADDHPTRAQALLRTQATEAAMLQVESATRARLLAELTQSRAFEADNLLNDAERKLEERKKSRELLKQELASARTEFDQQSGAIARSLELRGNEKRQEDLLKQIDDRIDEERVESRAPVRVTLRTPAVPPNEPTDDNGWIFALLAVAGGAFLGVVAAILALIARPRVLAAQIATRIGLPVLLRTPNPATPREAAALTRRLRADTAPAPLRLLILPIDPVAELTAMAVAEAITAEASRAGSTLLIGLNTPTPPDTSEPHHEELTRSKQGGSAVAHWKSLGGAEAMRAFLESAEFRMRFEELSAQHDTRIIGLSPELAPTKALHAIFVEGYQVVLLAEQDHTRFDALEGCARLISENGGTVAGVVVIDPRMSPFARGA